MYGELNDEIAKTTDLGFTDVVILHEGSIVSDWHVGRIDRVNYVFSCTKSVLSILFGILVDQVADIHLEDSIERHLPITNELHKRISIRNLLSMTSGIAWADMKHGTFEYNKMVKSDWLHYVLAKPVVVEDIGKFNYCDGNSLLLSKIITQYTKVSALEFAHEMLFTPLGIEKVKWKEQDGVSMGGTGLHMKSADLAKIGDLMLNNGSSFGKKILSSDWISKATTYQSEGHPEWFGNYGLHWWISPYERNKRANLYFALGAHGQFLFVLPEKKLVVCIRKKVGRMSQMNSPLTFLYEKILPEFASCLV